METVKSQQELLREIEELKHQLEEVNDTIEAIRTGQVDALVVQGGNGHQLYTLKSADHTYRVFIEKMTEGAVTLDQSGIIVYSNSKFASMVGLPLSGVLGRTFGNFVEAGSRKAYDVLFDSAWKEDVKGELLLHHGERHTPVLLSLTTLDLDEGVSLSIILTDLTSQKETQQQLSLYNNKLEASNQALEDSNHDLQQFASVASHDLQEPLRKIQIFSNLMHEKFGHSMPEEARHYLGRIIDSARRMKTLIVDILNYSRLSSLDHHFELVELNALVSDVLEDFELIIQEKNALIQVDRLPSICINRGQIRQVFQNIISNALKFVKPGEAPWIHIQSKRIESKSFDGTEQPGGPYCLISITDHGIGFDEQYATNIFALFERLNSKDKYEGTGIGLAIAKKILEKHDGLIDVKSSEGQGATFRIILPVAQG